MRASNLSVLLQQTTAEALRLKALMEQLPQGELLAAAYAEMLAQLGKVTADEHADHQQGPAGLARDWAMVILAAAKIRHGVSMSETGEAALAPVKDQVGLLALAEALVAEARADDEDGASLSEQERTW